MVTPNDKTVMDTNAVMFEIAYKCRQIQTRVDGREKAFDISKRDSRIENTHVKYSSYRQRQVPIFITATIIEELATDFKRIAIDIIKSKIPSIPPTLLEFTVRKMIREWTNLRGKDILLFTNRPSYQEFNSLKNNFVDVSKSLTKDEIEKFIRNCKPNIPEDSDINIICESMLMDCLINLMTNDDHFCSFAYCDFLKSKGILIDEIL